MARRAIGRIPPAAFILSGAEWTQGKLRILRYKKDARDRNELPGAIKIFWRAARMVPGRATVGR